MRQPNETVTEYVAELRALARYCKFKEFLDDSIRDRLVCGIGDGAIQRRLLAEPKLTFAKAMEIAVSMETAQESLTELANAEQNKTDDSTVHKLTGGSSNASTPSTKCYRCSGSHAPDKCRYKAMKCHNCGKIGHIQRACRSAPNATTKPFRRVRGGKRPQPVRQLSEEQIYNVNKKDHKPFQVTMVIDRKEVQLDVDTGASSTLMSLNTFKQFWPEKKLQRCDTRLRTYAGEIVPIVGKANVTVEYKGQQATLPLLVVEILGPTLLGRNWLSRIRLDWPSLVCRITEDKAQLDNILQKHSKVFTKELGKLVGYKAKIHVDANVTPKFFKARSIPYAMRAKIEEELEKLKQQGILEPIAYSEWATPIVPVLKPDCSVRICGDFKITVNTAAKLEKYPIPRIEDLFATLGEGKSYTKLDMTQAYQQIELDEESKSYTVINTHKGLFKYSRLPFGIASAPAIFQRVMEGLLQNIPGVIIYLDDVLITGRTNEEHLRSLEKVLTKMEEAGLRLKAEKCTFMNASVEYLGHRIDAQGLHPLKEKVEAVRNAPNPTNVSELKAFLGLLTYYNRFLSNLCNVLSPLYRLLRKEVKWQWTMKEEEAFNKAKDLLTSAPLLVHYDPSKDLILSVDASPYGVGAVLAHVDQTGCEKPIGYASRTLTPAEHNYAQMEREGLACIFGIKKFHSYLWGRSFKLYTDNLALKTLFNERQATPQNSSSRIQRWALTLSSYEYEIVFRPSHQHSNADALSRLPLHKTEAPEELPARLVLVMETLDTLPITGKEIAKHTREDSVLARVYRYVQHGWPEAVPEELKRFHKRRLELSTLDGCNLIGARVVIPPKVQRDVRSELHLGHPGISRMKSLARLHVWWPDLDIELEKMVKTCEHCQETKPDSPRVPLEPWKWPSRPWSRVYVDYAGPFLNSMFFIVVDAHSKWVEIFKTRGSDAATTINCLRSTFARFGLPSMVVSDNGPCFTSRDFKKFLQWNGVTHVTSAPYHPQSNGLAEKMVQTFKNSMKRQSEGSVELKLTRFLMSYSLGIPLRPPQEKRQLN